jgi:hypothetical protein
MAFYRVGEVVASGREPALIGLALKTPDLNATVAQMRLCGGPVADPKPAVQGGRIASVRGDHLNWGPRGMAYESGLCWEAAPAAGTTVVDESNKPGGRLHERGYSCAEEWVTGVGSSLRPRFV